LVRYGESVTNTQKDLLGANPKTPLTEFGRLQAKAAGEFLKKKLQN
jgi:broad specificity phosphatase PhoE